MDSSYATKAKTNLSVRNQPRFKKSSVSSTVPAAKKITASLSLREQTLLKKAYELSTLCDVQVCVLYYGRDGELIKTWPEDQSKVRDMAERFSRLSDVEKGKKSTNLSQFLNKKMNDDKKKSLEKNDNVFSQKILEMEDSLVKRLQMFQDKLRRLYPRDQTEMSAVSTDHLVDPQTQPLTNHLTTQSRDVYSTDLSTLNYPSNCSILLYNHDNATFTQLTSTSDQRSCNNFQMQTQNPLLNFGQLTQNPLLNFDQFATWNQIQTPSFEDQSMFSSCC